MRTRLRPFWVPTPDRAKGMVRSRLNVNMHQGSRVRGQGSRVKGQGSRVKGQGSRVRGQGCPYPHPLLTPTCSTPQWCAAACGGCGCLVPG